MAAIDYVPKNHAMRCEKSVKRKMAPFIGFGWGWRDPRTLSPLEIDFLLIINDLQGFEQMFCHQI